jgi:hypothetical protein
LLALTAAPILAERQNGWSITIVLIGYAEKNAFVNLEAMGLSEKSFGTVPLFMEV